MMLLSVAALLVGYIAGAAADFEVPGPNVSFSLVATSPTFYEDTYLWFDNTFSAGLAVALLDAAPAPVYTWVASDDDPTIGNILSTDITETGLVIVQPIGIVYQPNVTDTGYFITDAGDNPVVDWQIGTDGDLTIVDGNGVFVYCIAVFDYYRELWGLLYQNGTGPVGLDAHDCTNITFSIAN